MDPYTCSVCQKTFTRNSNLRRHLKRHESIKTDLRCQLCNSTNFSREDSLIRHQRDCMIKKNDIYSQGFLKDISKPRMSTSGFSVTNQSNTSIREDEERENSAVYISEDGRRFSTILPADVFQIGSARPFGQDNILFPSLPNDFLDTSLHIPRRIPSCGQSPLKFESPHREEYFSNGIPFFTKIWPVLHKPTFNPDLIHPFVREGIIVKGALYTRGTPELMNEAAAYVINVLESDLRNQIFREIMELDGSDNVHLQYELLLAFNMIQLAGSSHKLQSTVERHITDGYHTMAAAMIRKSIIPSTICRFRRSINLSDPSTSIREKWTEWVHYESMKRAMLVYFMLDSRRGDLTNQPPCCSDDELDDLGIFLPAKSNLWFAPSPEEWFHLAKSSDRTNLLGLPLTVAVEVLLSGTEVELALSNFDTPQGFILIHGLIRIIYVYFISSLHDQHRYRVKKALDTWSQKQLGIVEESLMKWTSLFIYMQAVVVHDDTRRLVDQAENNYQMFTGWIEALQMDERAISHLLSTYPF